MVRGMKKIVAVSLAAGAATLVAVWRKIVRDNESPEDEIAMEPGMPLDAVPPTADGGSSGGSARPAGAGERPGSAGSTPRKQSGGPTAASTGRATAATVNEKSSRAELYGIAQELKIDGRSRMSKAELLRAIRAAG